MNYLKSYLYFIQSIPYYLKMIISSYMTIAENGSVQFYKSLTEENNMGIVHHVTFMKSSIFKSATAASDSDCVSERDVHLKAN